MGLIHIILSEKLKCFCLTITKSLINSILYTKVKLKKQNNTEEKESVKETNEQQKGLFLFSNTSLIVNQKQVSSLIYK